MVHALTTTQILVVDDDPDTIGYLINLLTGQGYSVTSARSGWEALDMLTQRRFSLLLLDIRLPGPSGLDLLMSVRETAPNLPVLLMTAFPSFETAIAGLDLRAHGYVTKPFNSQALLARVQALLAQRAMPEMVQCEDLVISFKARRTWRGEQKIELTPLEFDLLAYLVRRAEQVVTWEELLSRVWGCAPDTGSQEMVRSCAKRLRRKLEPGRGHPRYLTTVWGRGYRWEVMPERVTLASWPKVAPILT